MSEPELTQVFKPVSAQSGEPIELAMQELRLVGRILPVGARLLVKHTFRSAEKKPLEVVYSFGLPRDAALRRFRIMGTGFSVASELKPADEAREAYEKGLADGHLAAMAQLYGDGVVNLTVGNIRPGESVTVLLEILAGVETRDDGLRFRFPFTLAPTYHARAKAAEVEPGRGEIELPDDEFGDVILPQFVADASKLHSVGFDLSIDMPGIVAEIGSPSHPVRIIGKGSGKGRISLATENDLPNRDLVLDVRLDRDVAGVIGGEARDRSGRFAAVMPSTFFAKDKAMGEAALRRIIFVLDRSGSMEGAAISQARKAIEACLGALDEKDEFGLVAFDEAIDILDKRPLAASASNRERARAFLAGIDARGGTELSAGIEAAATIMKKGAPDGGSGDILVVTDGQVSGTERIIESARSLGLRLHCLGIGSASEDRFLALLSRETGGRSRFLTPRERVDLGAVELFASIGRPVAKNLKASIEGSPDGMIIPDPPDIVYPGSPAVIFGKTSSSGIGTLALSWKTDGRAEEAHFPLEIGKAADGETIRLLQGARLITGAESRLTSREGSGNKRDRERIDRRLRSLSEEYGLASRAMSLVAVVKRAGDRPGDLPVTRIVPVGLAQDVAFGRYFKASATCYSLSKQFLDARANHFMSYSRPYSSADCAVPGPKIPSNRLPQASRRAFSQDVFFDLASAIEPDGGMPGKTEEERVLATILAILQFLADGHSVSSGVFRAHVTRLVGFLERAKIRNDILEEIIGRARSGRPLGGDWFNVRPGRLTWERLDEALEEER